MMTSTHRQKHIRKLSRHAATLLMIVLGAQTLFPGPGSAADEATEVIPIRLHPSRNAILVELEVAGRQVQMLIDTGATTTVVSAETLGWGRARLKKAEFSRQGPGIRLQGTWEEVDVRLGDSLWRDRLIAVMDFAAVRQVFGKRVAGILGQDILTEFAAIELDFQNLEMRLHKPASRRFPRPGRCPPTQAREH